MAELQEQPPRGVVVRINDIFGIRNFVMSLRPGVVNKLLGANGVGKTSAILAALRGLGAEVDVTIRDGATLGTIEVDGGDEKNRVVVPAQGRVRTTGGEVPVTAADIAALTRLITGDHRKDAGPRAKARIEAFLQLVRPRVDESAIEILCERDEEMMNWLAAQVASSKVTDLLAAGDALREELQDRARHHEGLAKSWDGQEAAHLQNASKTSVRLQELTGDPDPIRNPDPDKAAREVEASARELEKITTAAAHRREREAQRDRIAAEATPRPDPESAFAEVQAILKEMRQSRLEAEQLEQEIARLQERLAGVRQKVMDAERLGRNAEQRWKAMQAAAEQWDRQQAILQEEIQGPTSADVARAEDALEDARTQADVHRLSADLTRLRAEADESSKNRSREAGRGKQFRDWSKAIQHRITDVLSAQGASAFTVVDGRLAYRLDGGDPVDFDTRLSTGQQIWAGLEIAAARFRGLVWIDHSFYASLDFSHQADLERFAQLHPDVLLITEQPTEGELRIEHGEGVR